MAAALREGRDCQVTIRNYRKGGEAFWNEVSLSPVHDDDGELTHYIGILDDVTAVTEATERAQHLARHDVAHRPAQPRACSSTACARPWPGCRGTRARWRVLFLDIDDFKFVNDSHGHPVGDELLRAVPARLTEVLRRGDTLARFGGDEFALLCTDLGEPAPRPRRSPSGC